MNPLRAGLTLHRKKVERFRREAEYMTAHWAPELANDPFYNPNLALNGSYGQLAGRSRRKKPWLKTASASAHGGTID